VCTNAKPAVPNSLEARQNFILVAVGPLFMPPPKTMPLF
jgi:hypothetical protein